MLMPPASLPLPSDSNDLVWSPDGLLVACAADDAAVHVIEIASGTLRLSLGDHDVDEVTAADFAPDGARLASTDLSSTVYLWDAKTGEPIAQSGQHHGGHFIAFSADGRTLVSAGHTEAVALLSADDLRQIGLLNSTAGEITLSAIAHDRTTFAVYTAHDRALIWDLSSRELRVNLRAPEMLAASCLALSPDGHALALGHTDGSVTRWALPGGELTGRARAHEGAVRFLAFSPDGALLASSGPDQLVRLWHPIRLTAVALHPTAARPGLLAFSPDSRVLALDSGAGALNFWAREGESFTRPGVD